MYVAHKNDLVRDDTTEFVILIITTLIETYAIIIHKKKKNHLNFYFNFIIIDIYLRAGINVYNVHIHYKMYKNCMYIY